MLRALTLAVVAWACGGSLAAEQVSKPAKTPAAGLTQVPERWRTSSRAFRAGEPAKPAVLLFHGLHSDLLSWTAPGDTENVPCLVFREAPEPRSLGSKSYPGVGVYKISVFKDEVDANAYNWFDFLADRGCTVAAFTQGGLTLDDARESAVSAMKDFLEDTAKLNPSAPPPVALIGHSRGGLVIRRLIKDHPELMGRVKWVITLHSPHQGSEVARTPEALEKEIARSIDALSYSDLKVPPEFPLPDLKHQLATEATNVIVKLLGMAGLKATKEDLELAPDSPQLRDLAKDEKMLDGAKYYTFGGTVPTYMRIYGWYFTPDSAVPQTSIDKGVYYKWEVRAQEIRVVSPIMDVIRDIYPEIVPGKGDGLVADERARLPWAAVKHETSALNHAEALFSRELQQKVAGILFGLTATVADRNVLSAIKAQPQKKKTTTFGRIKTDTSVVKPAEGTTAGAARGRPPGPDGSGATRPLVEGLRLTRNADLKGRLGRLIVQYPRGSKDDHDVKVYKPREDVNWLAADRGKFSQELMPGTYDLTITSKRIEGVEVRSGHDTVVTVGLLRVHAGAGTQWKVFSPGEEVNWLAAERGEGQVALPAGDYQLQVAGKRQTLTIKPGEVTEF